MKRSYLHCHRKLFHSALKTQYDCNLCTFQTRHKNTLKTHVITMHQESKKVICKDCNKTLKVWRKRVLVNIEKRSIPHYNHSMSVIFAHFKLDIRTVWRNMLKLMLELESRVNKSDSIMPTKWLPAKWRMLSNNW